MPNLIKNILSSILEVSRATIEDRCFYRAAALAYNGLLTLVPFLSIVLLIVATVPIMSPLESKAENFLFSNLFPDSSQLLHSEIKTLALQARKLSWISIAFLFVTVFILLKNIEDAFNHIWKITPKTVNLLNYLFRYTIYLVVMPCLLGAILLANSYLQSVLNAHGAIIAPTPLTNITQLIPGILIFIMLLGLYKFVPRAKIPFFAAGLGALFSTVIFLTTKFLFMLYINSFSDYKILYGTFAVLPIFLIWLYIIWVIILIGFELIRHIYTRQTFNDANT